MTKITEPVNLLETADMEEVKNLSTVNDAEPDSTDLIQVAQIPVIIENLKLVKSEIEKKVKHCLRNDMYRRKLQGNQEVAFIAQ